MKSKPELCIAIPASLVSDVHHLREKTSKIGMVGRAAAIFQVTKIFVFPDISGLNQNRDARLIATLLSYIETPQYLRKRLFPIRPELRYAGILPPLRTPHHPLANKLRDLTLGNYREGVVIASTENGSLVDIGVERPLVISQGAIPVNTRVSVRIIDLGEPPMAAAVSHDEIREYWGYQVVISDERLGQLMKSQPFDLIVATSKHGTSITRTSVMNELATRWKKSYQVLVAFGAPRQGLHKIVAQERLRLSKVADFVINTIPRQGTETVRTEEAIYASLAIFNSFISIAQEA